MLKIEEIGTGVLKRYMETQYFPLKFFCKPKTASPAGCGGAGQLRL